MDTEREPTPDEREGMAWWNGLTEASRARWLSLSNTATPATAWAEHKRRGPTGEPRDESV